jgi:ferrous iron transport protein B
MEFTMANIVVALAGNANVGKSVIFNELTGLHQHVGNWPGKTVERAEGTLNFEGQEIDVIDLPGIYSLSTYSIEELISREYIAVEHPDVIVNVLDASSLERNLAFTLQLLELEPHIVIALNQIDVAENKGIIVHPNKLSEELGIPVVPTVAIKAAGLTELMRVALEEASKDIRAKSFRYGPEVEDQITELIKAISVDSPYPLRWICIKLLEGDEKVERMVFEAQPNIRERVLEARVRLEEVHGHDAASIIASERYALASRIATECSNIVVPEQTRVDQVLGLTTHRFWGYVFMIASILIIFFVIFSFGDWFAGLFDLLFGWIQTHYFSFFGESAFSVFFWDAIVDGVIGGVTVALPYIVPFYIVLSVLEDSGYLARIAFLMDVAMHNIGLHGKGFIPVMLGFGCNVPAILGCRIMETEREQLICAFVASLVPCAARSIVIFGLVATYVGFEWAIFLYLIDFVLIFILGRLAYQMVPGEPVGLIMEMPGYRTPSIRVTAQRAWFRLRHFVFEAFPIMIMGNFVIQVAAIIGLLEVFEGVLSPVTVGWLGLPFGAGIVLLFGVLRKELTLILLASVMGTVDYSSFLTPVQMFVFAFVVMVYVPCISTIAALVKEFGYRRAGIITGVEVIIAVVLGGIILRVLQVLGLP